MQPTEAEEKIYQHLEIINKLAAKRFSNPATAEEAALFVLEGLSHNSWQRVCSFQEKSRFTTFLSALCWRLLEDFSRKKFGRKRAPQWLQKLGGCWMMIYRLLCLERYSFSDTVEIVVSHYSTYSSAAIERQAEKILGEIHDCGQTQNIEEEWTENKEEYASAEDVHHQVEEQQKNLVLNALQLELFGEEQEATYDLISTLQQHIKLNAEEQLLLKLRHREQFSIAEIGTMLKKNRFQLNGKLRWIYAKIRSQLQEAGLEEELQLFLRQ